MSGFFRRYVDFWNEREAPDTLALLRITFGLATFANALHPILTGKLVEYFADKADGGIFRFGSGHGLSVFQIVPATARAVTVLGWAELVFAALLTLGLFTRTSAFACLVLQMTFAQRLHYFAFGSDAVYRVFSYLMVLAPLAAAHSLDARFFGRGREDVPKWPRRLLMAQLTILYVRTGIVKVGSAWSLSDGWSALYYALNLPGMARFPGSWVASVYPLSQIGTFVSKWWEITFFLVPLNLYLRRKPEKGGRIRKLFARWDLRWAYLGFGAGMHLLLLVLMNLGFFSIVMWSLYPMFLEPEEAKRFFGRVTELSKKARASFGKT